jgi:hypothetical protein
LASCVVLVAQDRSLHCRPKGLDNEGSLYGTCTF